MEKYDTLSLQISGASSYVNEHRNILIQLSNRCEKKRLNKCFANLYPRSYSNSLRYGQQVWKRLLELCKMLAELCTEQACFRNSPGVLRTQLHRPWSLVKQKKNHVVRKWHNESLQMEKRMFQRQSVVIGNDRFISHREEYRAWKHKEKRRSTYYTKWSSIAFYDAAS